MSTKDTASRAHSYPRRCRGSTMMEVLVSVFVLSIGVLGVAGLQVTAKRSNFEATQRVTAAALAQDIIERMRSNSEELGTYTNAGAGRTINGTSMPLVDCSTERSEAHHRGLFGALRHGGQPAPRARLTFTSGGYRSSAGLRVAGTRDR